MIHRDVFKAVVHRVAFKLLLEFNIRVMFVYSLGS